MKAPMTGKEFVEFHKKTVLKMNDICRAKNQDYSGGGEASAFNNFTMVEKQDICSTEAGFLVRMTDKMSRIKNLINNGDNAVKDESISDTLMDLANYSILMMGYIQSKNRTHLKEQREESLRPKPARLPKPPKNNNELLEKFLGGPISEEDKKIGVLKYQEGYRDGFKDGVEAARANKSPKFDPLLHVDTSVYGYANEESFREVVCGARKDLLLQRDKNSFHNTTKTLFLKITPYSPEGK